MSMQNHKINGSKEQEKFTHSEDQTTTKGLDDSLSGKRDQRTGDFEACIIVLAHPRSEFIGKRYTIENGATLVIGRASDVDLSFIGVPSLSRYHCDISSKTAPSV